MAAPRIESLLSALLRYFVASEGHTSVSFSGLPREAPKERSVVPAVGVEPTA